MRRGDLEARAHWKPEVECGEGSVTDDSVLIMEKYLRGQEGSPGNNPHQCGQVACYWGAYITWCNDVGYPPLYPSLPDLPHSSPVHGMFSGGKTLPASSSIEQMLTGICDVVG